MLVMRVLLGVAKSLERTLFFCRFISRKGETRLPIMSTAKGRAGGDSKQRRMSAPSGSRARSVRKPEEILRDVRGLKLRQRVSLALNDKGLRDELEEIVDNFVQNGPKKNAEGFRTYQDFLIPSSTFYSTGMAPSSVHPISDIRGSESLNYSKQERLLRCKLASVYRLAELFKWTIGIYGHITARASADQEHYLINPFGLLYSEVTASSLIKVDSDGNIIDGGSTCLGVNKAGLVIHSAIHSARKNVKCVIHIHQQAAVAVSMMKQGLMPLSLEAMGLGEISYHDFEGVTVNEAEKETLVNDFKENSKVMFLRNHGLVVVGETIEEALDTAVYAVRACEYQVRAMAAGVENLIQCDEKVQQQCAETVAEGVSSTSGWKTGELEFEAYMRMLDSMGYKTGYVYKNPEVFQGDVKPDREVTTPATVTSSRSRTPYYTPEIERGPVRRAHSTGRANTYRNRLKWLNTPVKSTEYKKEKEKAEIDVDYEPAIIKDLQPEKTDKDVEVPNKKEVDEDVVLPTAKVVEVESAPYDNAIFNGEDTEVATKVDGEVDGKADNAPAEQGGVAVQLTVPGIEEDTSPRKKKGTKVKKNPSFKDKIVKRFGRKGDRPKSEKVDHGETATANEKAD